MLHQHLLDDETHDRTFSRKPLRTAKYLYGSSTFLFHTDGCTWTSINNHKEHFNIQTPNLSQRGMYTTVVVHAWRWHKHLLSQEIWICIVALQWAYIKLEMWGRSSKQHAQIEQN